MSDVKTYHAFGHAFDVEDWPGHLGADAVGRELADGVVYGLPGLGLKPGDVVVDAGAHVGLVSMTVARLYPGVRVLALEPHPVTFGMLARNLARNRVEGVEAVPLGVAGRCGPLALRCPRESVGPSTWLTQEGESSALAAGVTLPTLFRRYGVAFCAWLKMDVEGAEHETLLACGPAFFSRVGRLSLELHAGSRLARAGYAAPRLRAHLDAGRVRYDVSNEIRFSD